MDGQLRNLKCIDYKKPNEVYRSALMFFNPSQMNQVYENLKDPKYNGKRPIWFSFDEIPTQGLMVSNDLTGDFEFEIVSRPQQIAPMNSSRTRAGNQSNRIYVFTAASPVTSANGMAVHIVAKMIESKIYLKSFYLADSHDDLFKSGEARRICVSS